MYIYVYVYTCFSSVVIGIIITTLKSLLGSLPLPWLSSKDAKIQSSDLTEPCHGDQNRPSRGPSRSSHAETEREPSLHCLPLAYVA